MFAPEVTMVTVPPFTVVASKAEMVAVGLIPRKSFETTL
jgi:hypothetical protein